LKNIFYTVQDYFIASDSIAEDLGFPGFKYFYLTSYNNSPEADVYGFEIDLQTSLKFLPSPFNGFVINANFTRLYSNSTKYWYTTHDTTYRDPVTGTIITETTLVSKQRDISIPGQVPYIFNLSVGYDFKGFSARISGVFQGTYLKIPRTQDFEDIYVWKFWRWDASLSQKISKNFKVYLNFTNFNNQKEESYVNKNLNSPYRIQEYGMIIFLGVMASL
jgi:outer membrane receptor protein involved in Fe transport